MSAYLDNASTTRIRAEVQEAVSSSTRDAYGNPSSVHAVGRRARRAVEDARERIGSLLGASPRQVLFTSGATEANNLAIRGSNPWALVATSIEHESVLASAKRLASQGVAVRWLPVDAGGTARTALLEGLLGGSGGLVSAMLVNNELGTIQPVPEIARIARAAGALLHCDATQALGKIPLNLGLLDADFVSISSHKVHGPKGVGALVVREPARLDPILFGGAQEFEKRAGTENVAGIAGFCRAVELALSAMPKSSRDMESLRDKLERGLLDRIPGVAVNADGSARAPHISNLRFEGIDGEALMMALDACGIWVSAGSACAALGTEPSHVLAALGLPAAAVRGSIRFSLALDTTAGEIEEALQVLPAVVAKLRG